jgi:protein-tyrosine phosphatase
MITSLSPFTVLFVCTGNLCRSPLAEATARRALAADASVQVGSAGTNGVDGHQLPAQTIAAGTRAGLSLDEMRARRLTRAMADESDLVVTMTRQQRREVVRLAPSATRRTFTLLELDRVLRFAFLPANADRLAEATEHGDARPKLVEFASAIRGLASRPSDVDDIDDPYQGPDRAFDRAVKEIEPAVVAMCAAIQKYPSPFVDVGLDRRSTE